ncbi:hypothetical protein PCANC_04019 [Puccinia coronata f. sp. avenae]|uniref:Uncharacterized protein n=1 Tax=Puccinia coronata f. sp. avenae TaxID=200324 RepID=A0A2N5T7R4_9BASI|nr:hypothetical protein PCANC_04019 [Puccinia coronata f. sp. avenae]
MGGRADAAPYANPQWRDGRGEAMYCDTICLDGPKLDRVARTATRSMLLAGQVHLSKDQGKMHMRVKYNALAQPALWCFWRVALAHPGFHPAASRTLTPGLQSTSEQDLYEVKGLTRKRSADNQFLDILPEYPGGRSYQTDYGDWRSSQTVSPTDFLLLGTGKRQKEGENDYGGMNTHSHFASPFLHAGHDPSQDEMIKTHYTQGHTVQQSHQMDHGHEHLSTSYPPLSLSPYYGYSNDLGLVSENNIYDFPQSDSNINPAEQSYGTFDPSISYWQSELLPDLGNFDGVGLLFEQLNQKSTQGEESSTTHRIQESQLPRMDQDHSHNFMESMPTVPSIFHSVPSASHHGTETTSLIYGGENTQLATSQPQMNIQDVVGQMNNRGLDEYPYNWPSLHLSEDQDEIQFKALMNDLEGKSNYPEALSDIGMNLRNEELALNSLKDKSDTLPKGCGDLSKNGGSKGLETCPFETQNRLEATFRENFQIENSKVSVEIDRVHSGASGDIIESIKLKLNGILQEKNNGAECFISDRSTSEFIKRFEGKQVLQGFIRDHQDCYL